MRTLNLENNLVENIQELKKLPELTKLELGVSAQVHPPIWYLYLKYKGGKLGDYIDLPDLPFAKQIWELLASNDKTNEVLAQQMAEGQGWTEEEFNMHSRAAANN